ncbi:putative nucleotidyltransferase substrate binding domain-containing protein [Granulosicoccaceae sp. 1_MG-2023]|nr:putative nucleotidyltransferase substrate binding domain-containing protein [Granulosicoccaceae sp. 1_MG-2023]
MEAEQIEIAGFLRQYAPFDDLPEEVVDRVACSIEISYFRAGSEILTFGEEIHELCMVRSGAVEIYRRNGDLYNRLSEGELFGQVSLLMKNVVRLPARALEDSLIYFIPESEFTALCDEFESFAYFVEMEDKTLRQAVSQQYESHSLMMSKVTALNAREPVLIDVSASIREAAQKMTEEDVSCLVIMQDWSSAEPGVPEQGYIAGLITDRDLRERVLAAGVSPDAPVSEVMRSEPVTLDKDAYAFEAMMTMLRANIHHLPVLDGQDVVRVIATSDIVRYESNSSMYLVSTIMSQSSVAGLAALKAEINASFVRLVDEDANSHMIGSAMSVIGRSLTQRLLELAEEQLGKPPLPYCFLALGSMARDEQLVLTDQDNALILDDRYDEAVHGEYFAALAKFVSDGLNDCGYSYCTGGIMASNPKWRKTRRQWESTFGGWIDKPDREALLNCSIFFDLDGVHGKTVWAEQLNVFIASKAKSSPRFLGSLARNALNRRPPLGFFKNFVVEKDGEHRESINLKRRGTAPLSDLIRVHALAAGSRAQNSFERLDHVMKAGILPAGSDTDLRDALEFISMVRIRHQAADLKAGIEVDNNVEPESLSDFERRNLKEAFQVCSNAQRFLRFRYPYTTN